MLVQHAEMAASTFMGLLKTPLNAKLRFCFFLLKNAQLMVTDHSRGNSAPHMHVLVCICSNVQQFNILNLSVSLHAVFCHRNLHRLGMSMCIC